MKGGGWFGRTAAQMAFREIFFLVTIERGRKGRGLNIYFNLFILIVFYRGSF